MDADTGAPHLITVPPAPAPVIVAPPAVKEATRFLTDLYYIDDLNTSFENALKTNPITERNDKITSILATKKYGCKYDDLEAGLARIRQTSFVPWTGTYTVYDTRDSKGGALILTVRGSKTGILFLCINGTPVYEVVDTSDSTTRSLRYTDSLSSKVGQITFKMHDSRDRFGVAVESRYACLTLYDKDGERPKNPTHEGVETTLDFATYHGIYDILLTSPDGAQSAGSQMYVNVKEPSYGVPTTVELVLNDGKTKPKVFTSALPTSLSVISWTPDDIHPDADHHPNFAYGRIEFKISLAPIVAQPGSKSGEGEGSDFSIICRGLVWSEEAEKDPSHPGQYQFEGVYLMPNPDKAEPEEPVSVDGITVDSVESTTTEPASGVAGVAPAPGSESAATEEGPVEPQWYDNAPALWDEPIHGVSISGIEVSDGNPVSKKPTISDWINNMYFEISRHGPKFSMKASEIRWTKDGFTVKDPKIKYEAAGIDIGLKSTIDLIDAIEGSFEASGVWSEASYKSFKETVGGWNRNALLGCVALGGAAVVVYHGRTEMVANAFKFAALELTPVIGGGGIGTLSYMQRKMAIIREPLYLEHQGIHKAFDPTLHSEWSPMLTPTGEFKYIKVPESPFAKLLWRHKNKPTIPFTIELAYNKRYLQQMWEMRDPLDFTKFTVDGEPGHFNALKNMYGFETRVFVDSFLNQRRLTLENLNIEQPRRAALFEYRPGH